MFKAEQMNTVETIEKKVMLAITKVSESICAGMMKNKVTSTNPKHVKAEEEAIHQLDKVKKAAVQRLVLWRRITQDFVEADKEQFLKKVLNEGWEILNQIIIGLPVELAAVAFVMRHRELRFIRNISFCRSCSLEEILQQEVGYFPPCLLD